MTAALVALFAALAASLVLSLLLFVRLLRLSRYAACVERRLGRSQRLNVGLAWRCHRQHELLAAKAEGKGGPRCP